MLGTSLALGLVLSLLGGCAMQNKERLLAAGGIHALEGAEPCHLTQVEPASALEDLGWKDALVVRAHGEGRAELACGKHRARLRVVRPERLELTLVDDHVVVGRRFHVRAIARDHAGRELEVGKWTELVWRADGVIDLDGDRSAGELGQCDTCFGIRGFRASAAGAAMLEAHLGEAAGTLRVTARQ
jgi:hypothetical protein